MEWLPDVRIHVDIRHQQPDYINKSSNEQKDDPVRGLLLFAGTIGCHLGLPGGRATP